MHLKIRFWKVHVAHQLIKAAEKEGICLTSFHSSISQKYLKHKKCLLFSSPNIYLNLMEHLCGKFFAMKGLSKELVR